MKVKELIKYLQDAEKECPGMYAHLLDKDLNQYLVGGLSYGTRDGLIIYRMDDIAKPAPPKQFNLAELLSDRYARLRQSGFEHEHHLCQSICIVAKGSLK